MELADFHELCASFPGSTSDRPFGPDVVTHRVGGKMFALVNESGSEPLRVNLKCEPQLAEQLREEYPGTIIPGYHMNKRHWNTVLAADLDDALVTELVEDSYDLVVESLPRAQRPD